MVVQHTEWITNENGPIVPISFVSAHGAVGVQIRNFGFYMEQIVCLRLKQVRNVGRSPQTMENRKEKLSRKARSLLICDVNALNQ